MKKYVFLSILSLIIFACARVGSPEGGAKDITPPILLKTNIDTSRVNIPTHLRELRLEFDEYVNLKEISKNLIISPPIKKIKKILPSNLANKYILIQWDENLTENTTYNFNFGNSITDNNEGNILPYFNFAFSTGKELDNLYISGTITNAILPNRPNTKSNIVVGLYQENSDTKQKPYYITKADEDGYFELNYLSKGKYKIIAFDDENQNSIYDFGKEKIGFIKETINLNENISGLNFKIYPPKKNIKYIESKNIAGGFLMLFEGNPNKVDILSLSNDFNQFQVSHQPKSDSVKVWISKDGNNFKKESATQLQLSYIADQKKDSIFAFYKPNEKDELSLSNNKGNLLPPKQDFVISSNMDLKNINPQNWELKMDSVSQHFEAKISASNPSEIRVSADFKAGKNYTLKIPKESVISNYYHNLKTYIFNFEIDKPENYGSLVLRLQNKPNSYFWVQLIDSDSKIQYSQYTNSSEIRFTELKPNTYYARILVDSNNNNFWDNADFSEQILSEPAYILPKEISIRKLWEMVEDWNLE